MNQKKSTQTLKSILQTLTSVFLNWLTFFWQIMSGFVLRVKRQITKLKGQPKSTNVNNQITNTPFALQNRGKFSHSKKQKISFFQYLKLFTPKFRFKSWKWKKFIISMTMTFILTLQFTGINWWQLPKPAFAAAVIEIEPLTWDMVGLDSNKPATQGPQDYLVGSRVCNMSTNEPVRDVTVKYKNDGVNNGFTFINIATDTLYLDYLPPNDPTIPGTIANAVTGPYIFDNDANRLLQKTKYEINFTPTNCADFYVNFDITRTSAAFETFQRYYMEATAIDPAGNLLGPIRTPQPRQIYITKLISQARNTVLDFSCSVAGGPDQRGTVDVSVGDVMVCTARGHTATAYPQLSFTANFPNIVFQILDVNTSYSNPTGGVNSAVYADGCGWVQDPTSPDYYRSPTNCAGAGWPGQYTNNSGGEGTGLNVVTNYTVKVLSVPPTGQTVKVSNIVLDFSGGSFHYNADYGTDICPTINCLIFNIDDGQNSDLTIEKSHIGNFTLGANQYNIDIQNLTSISAKDVKLYDTLPVGYKFTSANPVGGTDANKWFCMITDPEAYGGQNRSIVCNFHNGTPLVKTDDVIGANGTQSLIFNVEVAVPPASTNSTNVACVKAINDTVPSNDCDPDPTTIIFGPNIKLTKDDNNPNTPPFGPPNEIFVAGSTHTYNFLVEKTTDAYNVDGPLTLVDTLPTGVNFVSSNNNDGWSCAESGQIIVCSRANGLTGTTADPSSKTNFSITVSVGLNAVDMDPVAVGTQVINTATVTSGSLDVNPADNTDTQTNNIVIPSPDLTVDKTDNNQNFVVGQTGTYIITVTNKNVAGAIPTTQRITLVDTLPTSFSYISAGNAPGSTGWSCTYSAPVITCTNDEPLIPGGSTAIQVRVNPTTATGSPFLNQVTVSTPNEDPINLGDNSDTESTPVIASGTINLSVEKRLTQINATNTPASCTTVATDGSQTHNCSSTIAAGDTITYWVDITNLTSGNGDDFNINVTDIVPSSLEDVQWRCNYVDGNGVYAGPTGSPRAWSALGVGNGYNACSDTGSNSVPPTEVSGTGNNISINTIKLRKAGGKVRVIITGKVKAGFAGSIANTATTTPGSGADSALFDNIYTVTAFVPGADLSIVKGTNFSNFTVGANSTYTLTVKNESTTLDTNGLITVRDVLPTQLDFVSASGAEWFCSYNATNRTVTCTKTAVLGAGQETNINLVVKPNAIVPAPGVTNSATVTYAGDGNPANNSSSRSTPIIGPNVDLSITKATVGNFELGQQATYRLNITNHNVGGATPALAPITITDQLPSGISFISATTVTGSPWVCTSTNDALPDNNNNGIVDTGDGNGINDGFETVSCSRYTNIAPNETATLDLNVLVTASVNTSAPITNEVRVTSSSDFCLDFTNTNCQANNRASVDVSVTPSADLAIYKRAISRTAQTNPPQFLLGNTETFEIEVVNNGPSAYTGNITFTDTLNSNFTFVATGSGGDGFTCSAVGQVVTCSKATGLTAGQSAKVRINVLVADPSTPAPIADTGADVGGDNVNNTATIDPATLTAANDKDNTNNSSTIVVDLETFATDLVLQKDDGDGEYALTPTTHNGPGPLFDEPLLEQNRQYFTTSTVGGPWTGTYTLEVLNKGPAIAKYPVTITDTLPTGLTYSSAFGVGWNCSASSGVNISCTYDINFDKNGNGTIDNNDDFLNPGESTGVAITVNVLPSLLPSQLGPGVVTNSATVTSGTPELTPADNTNTEITIIREAADLSVTKTDSVSPNEASINPPDDEFDYTITIHNDTTGYEGTVVGPIYATDYLPEGVVYNGSTTIGTTTDIASTGVCTWRLFAFGGNYVSFICDNTGSGAIEAPYPNLGFNQTSSLTFPVKVITTASAIEKNLVRVGANIDEPDNPDQVTCDRTDPPLADRNSPPSGRTNNCAINETKINGGTSADLVIVKQAGTFNDDIPPAETLAVNDEFDITFRVYNNGADPAEFVQLEDELPPGIVAKLSGGLPVYTINKTSSTVSVTNANPATRSCTYLGNTFRCFLRTIPLSENSGDPIIITLTARATTTGTKVNEAYLISETSDIVVNNNCDVNTPITGVTNCDQEVIQVGASTGGTPNIILLKRITGVYRQNTPVVTNEEQLFSQFNDDPNDATDDPDQWATNKWPFKDADGQPIVLTGPDPNPQDNVYLRGAVDGGQVQGDDEIEFTIYYVNNGGANAANVRLCDLVPNLDFVRNAYGSGKGIALMVEDGVVPIEDPMDYLTNAIGDDDLDPKKGAFFEPGTVPTNCKIKDGVTFRNMTSADNQYGAIAVDIGTVPFANSSGDPANSYGFIRFRAKVK